MDKPPDNVASWTWFEFIPDDGSTSEVEPEKLPCDLPPTLAAAAERVVADIVRGAPLPIELSYLPDADNEDVGMVLVTVNEWQYGFEMWFNEPEGETLFRLADGILMHLSESPAGWAEARPVCPGHKHPAVPRKIAGEAYWTCPTYDRKLARIGEPH